MSHHGDSLTGADRNHPPHKHAAGYISGWSGKLMEKYVSETAEYEHQAISQIMYARRYLHKNVTNIEATDKSVELLSFHVKVVLQAFESCGTLQASAISGIDLPRRAHATLALTI